MSVSIAADSLRPLTEDRRLTAPVRGPRQDKKSATADLTDSEVLNLAQLLIFAAQPMKAAIRDVTVKHRLGPRGAWFLVLIDSGLVTYPSDVADYLSIGRSTITAELAKLTKALLIRYGQDTNDRRRVKLVLTASGRRVVRSVRTELRGLILRGFSRYSRSEVNELSRILYEFCSRDL